MPRNTFKTAGRSAVSQSRAVRARGWRGVAADGQEFTVIGSHRWRPIKKTCGRFNSKLEENIFHFTRFCRNETSEC